MDNPQAEQGQGKSVAAAEAALWKIVTAAVEAQGKPEAALYVQHLLQAECEKVTREGPYKRVHFNLYQRLSDYVASYNARTGQQMSWFFGALADDSDSSLDESDCLERAREVADPPAGAVQTAAGYQEYGGRKVFLARWAHEHKGIPVERDYIQVLVNGKHGRPFALHRKWHEVDTDPGQR